MGQQLTITDVINNIDNHKTCTEKLIELVETSQLGVYIQYTV